MLMNQSPRSCEIAPHRFRLQATAEPERSWLGGGRSGIYSKRLFSVPQMVTSENKRNRGRHACCISLVSVWWGGSMGKFRRCALNRWVGGGGVGVGDPREGEDARRVPLPSRRLRPACHPRSASHKPPARYRRRVPVGGIGKKTYTLMIIERKTTGGDVRQRESALRQTHSAVGGASE